jgi:hypothetical protein
MKVVHALVGFGFCLPAQGCMVDIGLFAETLRRIESTSQAMTKIASDSTVEIKFALLEDYHRKYGLRFNEPHDRSNSSAYFNLNRAMIANLTIGAYASLDGAVRHFRREKNDTDNLSVRIASGVEAVANATISVIRQVGLPDFFLGDSCGLRTDQALALIYDEILAMGKDIDALDLTIHDKGECLCPFSKSLKFQANR